MDAYKISKWFRSFWGRIVISFIIIILPIYGMGIWMYVNSVNSRRDEAFNTMYNHLSAHVENIENEIERIWLLKYLSTTDINLHRLSHIHESLSIFEMTQATLLLRQRLQGIAFGSPYIQSANIYIVSIDRNISSAARAVADLEALAELNFRTFSSYLLHQEGRFVLNMPYPTNESDPFYIIWVEMDRLALKRSLNQLDLYGSGGAMMMDDYFLLASSDNYEQAQQIKQLLDQQSTRSLVVDGQTYLVAQVASPYLQMTFVKFVPERDVMAPFQIYLIWFMAFTGIVIGMAVIFVYSIQQEYKHRIKAQQAQLIRLQSQINTHFLYNSYFILHRMILLEDNENAAIFSQSLGTYLRFVTRNDGDLTPLCKEVEHARVYAEIQAMRFSSRVTLNFGDLSKEWNDTIVPRLIIQPIIENAFKYGLENKVSEGLLKISFEGYGQFLSIIIEDNGEALSDADLERLTNSLKAKDDVVETTGLINIHKRLRYHFGSGSGLAFFRSDLGGLKTVIRIAV